jgi:hypothetical protein
VSLLQVLGVQILFENAFENKMEKRREKENSLFTFWPESPAHIAPFRLVSPIPGQHWPKPRRSFLFPLFSLTGS